MYRTLTYCEDYHSFAEYQDMRDRIIVVQSFSKPYAMTGWRLGYCMADAKLMDRIQVFHQYCVTSVPSFVQRACVTALETDTSDVVEIFRRRRDYVYQRLVDMGSRGSFDWSEHPSLSAGLSANRSLPFLFRVVHIVQGHADGDDTGHQSNPYILQAVAHKPVIQERQRRKSPQDRHNHSGRTGQCHHFDYIQNILHLSLPPSLYPSVPS